MIELLILGSSGFVGKNLVRAFHKKYKLNLIDVKPDHELKNLKINFKKKNILKLTKYDLPKKNFIVINLCAVLGAKNYEKNYRNNVMSVIRLIKVLKKNKLFKGLIHFSSISAQRKISHYGNTKFLSENIVRNSNLPHIILQSEMIIGKGARSIEKIKKVSRFFPFFLLLPKGGNIIRYPIKIDKVNKIVLHIVKHKVFDNKTYSLISEKILFRLFLKKIIKNKIFIPIPSFIILFIAKILEKIFKNPIFTYDNAYGVVSNTELQYPKYILRNK